MRFAALVLVLPCLLAPPDFSGRWAGELQLRFADGRTVTQAAHLTLRQFGSEIEGSFGYNEDVQTRLKPTRTEADSVTLAAGSITLTLRVDGDRLVGDVKFPGAGAPATTAPAALRTDFVCGRVCL